MASCFRCRPKTMDRLDKIVAGQTGMTRSRAHKVIAAGQVSVDGNVCKKPDTKVDPENQSILVNGQEITYKKYRYFVLNKPAGLLTASTDKTRATVLDLFRNVPRHDHLFAVGRLDKDTTGLLIITDDGDYAHKVISPKSRVEKEYLVEVDAPVTPDAKERFREGIILADGTKCLPAEICIDPENSCKASITVFEGKYHQIKRMLGVLELGVVKLHRARIASLTLPDNLKSGEFAEITREEAYSVFE